MVQFNLLPDVKIDYIKARRQKRLVIIIAFVASAASLFVLLMLFTTVQFVQKRSISDLNSDIKSRSTELENTPDLTKVLTVQNQLKSLPAMYQQKPVASRFFNYIGQVTPSKAHISSTRIDFAAQTISLTGSADSLTTVNTFADTLKFTTYSAGASTAAKPAFSNVVLASFSRNDKGASYTLNFKFDKPIFSAKSDVTLTVPKITTTRSTVEQPTELFSTDQ